VTTACAFGSDTMLCCQFVISAQAGTHPANFGWVAVYDQLKQTLTCDDIGAGGVRRINRDLARCRQTLTRLGYDPEKIPE
jgi:hypothetical protein